MVFSARLGRNFAISFHLHIEHRHHKHHAGNGCYPHKMLLITYRLPEGLQHRDSLVAQLAVCNGENVLFLQCPGSLGNVRA
jgi:hypothetical protein